MAFRWNGFILHVALLAITLCQSVSALMWLHKRQPIVPNISELFPLLNGIWKFIAVLVRICHWFYPFFFFYHGATVPRGSQGLLIIKAFRSHSDTHTHTHTLSRTPLEAETSTWQHTTLTTDRHPCCRWIRTRSLTKRAAADRRLRRRGHWDLYP